MTLVLRCIALDDQPISQPLIGRFDERGGTLGRSDDATLSLPDPERRISRLQAKVLFRDGQYWIENKSDISPVLHNGHPVGPGMQVTLGEGDELQIGGYSLQAGFDESVVSDTLLRGRNTVPPESRSAQSPRPVPARAMPDAQDEQYARDIAMRAGGRAILEQVFNRLDPGKLEVLVGKRTLLEYLMPSRRAERLWAAYLRHYDVLRADAQHHFQRTFGDIFRTAYESQVVKGGIGSDETVRPDRT